MDEKLVDQLQESAMEWAAIQKLQYELDKKTEGRVSKDKEIISEYCARNRYADIISTLELLLKYPGLAKHDYETVQKFKESYPRELTVELIYKYEDVLDIYNEYLESGGEE